MVSLEASVLARFPVAHMFIDALLYSEFSLFFFSQAVTLDFIRRNGEVGMSG